MIYFDFKRYFSLNKFEKGFGLVDSILSIMMLGTLLTYSVYFASKRAGVTSKSNITRAINKEIHRDIERLKSDLWNIYYDRNSKGYNNKTSNGKIDCYDMKATITKLDNWRRGNNSKSNLIQSWTPSKSSNKVFTGVPVKITRQLITSRPLNITYTGINKSIANITYRVEWGGNNIQWLSVALGSEAHSWCPQMSY